MATGTREKKKLLHQELPVAEFAAEPLGFAAVGPAANVG